MATFTRIPVWLASALESRLADVGFRWTGKTAYRVTNSKTDVITVELVREPLCRKWNVPYGAIAIEPACFLPFAPSLERAKFQCCRTADVKPSSYLDCQIRCGVRRSISQSEVDNSPNLWFVDLEGVEQEGVLQHHGDLPAEGGQLDLPDIIALNRDPAADGVVEAGDVITYAYIIIGKYMTVSWLIQTTTITGTPTSLRLKIPASKTATKTMWSIGTSRNLDVSKAAQCIVGAGDTYITFYVDAAQGANAWAAEAVEGVNRIQELLLTGQQAQ